MHTMQSIIRSPSNISSSPSTFSSETEGFAEHMKRSSSLIEEHLENMYYINNNSVMPISNKTEMKRNVGHHNSNSFYSNYTINLETSGHQLQPELKEGTILSM